MLSLIVAGTAGIIGYADSAQLTEAITSAGVTFGGTVTLLVLILALVLLDSRR
ncbi:hypothetical protein ABT336_26490 [Micromonospora sp. NPDC000207]|uniref:hypothetical protein n=1 Tax=Micromonospora sp. NPDC000207 TaxID=3154246 RepID=UPI003320C07B